MTRTRNEDFRGGFTSQIEKGGLMPPSDGSDDSAIAQQLQQTISARRLLVTSIVVIYATVSLYPIVYGHTLIDTHEGAEHLYFNPIHGGSRGPLTKERWLERSSSSSGGMRTQKTRRKTSEVAVATGFQSAMPPNPHEVTDTAKAETTKQNSQIMTPAEKRANDMPPAPQEAIDAARAEAAAAASKPKVNLRTPIEKSDAVGEGELPSDMPPAPKEAIDAERAEAEKQKKQRHPSVLSSTSMKQKVYICPQNFESYFGDGELGHFIRDGIDKSTKMEQTNDPDEVGAVWVVDAVRCENPSKAVRESLERRKKKALESSVKDNTQGSTKVGQRWKLYLLDFYDSGLQGHGRIELTKLSNVLGKNNIFYATRAFTIGRNVTGVGLRDDEPIGDLGHRIDYMGERNFGRFTTGVVKNLQYGVRSDFVEELDKQISSFVVQEGGAPDRGDSSGIIDRITLPRPFDVAHFWKTGAAPRNFGLFRDAVNRAILELPAEASQKGIKNKVQVHTGWQGLPDGAGRKTPQEMYARALLEYKIVVVAQRDEWEGHYRLMEALAGGALVFTDPMDPMPLYFEDGKNLIVYHSLGELKEKVLYYLSHEEERRQVARKGYETALLHHRSWHLMERIIFGNWTSIHF